ncbi:MAG: ComF family protein [Gammaproteobacteria bacterium]|nr:ComF family protein [Gammaproteobacteria bacterium]MBQ0773369.1 ComF family protein [Gammaproteobacteria bacterium]
MINNYTYIRNTCLLCRANCHQTPSLCDQCEADLPRHDGEVCRCGLPVAAPANSSIEQRNAAEMLPPLCGRCLHRPPPFDRLISPYRYQWPLDRLIPAYKYHRQLSLEPLLTSLWRQHPPKHLPHALVAIPLHWQRHWGRGFNQSLRLADTLSRHWNIPVIQALARTTPTRRQQGLSAKARQKNVEHAFRCTEDVTGLHLAVIDDVVTTAATVRAACQCLIEAGASATQVLALARTC